MHTIWKGTIRIAKVQIPIKLYSANEDQDISFKQLHKNCGSSVSQLKFCSKCDQALDKDQILRGYDLGGGNYLEITDDDLKQTEHESDRCVVIEHFVNLSAIDPVYLKKHYYVGPEQVGQHTFQLLQSCLKRNNKIGIGYITIRSTQYLAAVRSMKDGIALSTLYFADEIRPIEQVMGSDKLKADTISPNAHEVFNMLVNSMTVPFNHEQYKNHHYDKLRTMIDSKINNQFIPNTSRLAYMENEGDSLLDIVEAIQRSIESVNLLNTPTQDNQIH
jgi:DNA end-binding protein Ku